jgi:hypothetical protein
MTESCELVGEGAAELAVATSIDLEDGLAASGAVAVQAARVSTNMAVPTELNIRGILPT